MRWIVRPGDGRTVREVLSRAGADGDAVSDGRVFVGPRRVRLANGELAATLLRSAGDFVAADKPAGIPTIPDHAGSTHALLTAVARALGVDPSRVHATSRLDRDVSGVVVFALTKAAIKRLARARAEGAYERRYVALAAREPGTQRGMWDVPIGRAGDPRLRMANGRDPVDARTSYEVVGLAPRGEAMLAVAPLTGRTHQIRV